MGDFESSPVNGDAVVHEDALVKLMDQTGYTMVQENGQRKFGGPPPDWTGPAPKGSEVFIGKIPRDVFENDLFPLFKQIGEIYEMRLMMDFSGCNRGFAFVTYANLEDAKKAINQLNNYEIRQGKYIGVVKSVDNCRLFVGSIPRAKTKEEIREEIGKVTDGVIDIILYNSPKDKTKNRGFAFVEYESHRAAAIARKKLLPGRITLWNQRIQVDWAEPEPEIDEDVMALVRVLYARNLMLSTSEETLKTLFEGDKAKSVEKVKKIHDYAFIHFASRDDAEAARERLNCTDVDGSTIEVVWAKPRDNASRYAVRLRGHYSGNNYNNSNHVRFHGTNFNGGLDSHNIPFGVHPQAGGHFIAYQSPNSIRGYGPHMASFRGRGGRGAAGLRGGRGYYQSTGSGRHQEFRYFDLPQSYSFMHTNPLSMMRPQKPPNQMLAEICQKQGWGEPQYQVVPFGHGEGSPNQTPPVFHCKVIIPNWGEYTTNKSFRSAEEAKQYAVFGVLSQMNVSWEGTEIPTYFDLPQSTALFSMAGATPVGPTSNF